MQCACAGLLGAGNHTAAAMPGGKKLTVLCHTSQIDSFVVINHVDVTTDLVLHVNMTY